MSKKKIERSDIESKIRQIKDEVDSTSEAAKPTAATVGAGTVAGLIGMAYLLGQRKARKRSTVVEVKRV